MKGIMKEFIDYIFYIGVVTTETFPLFVQLLQEKKFIDYNYKNYEEKGINLKKVFIEYFLKLTTEQIKIISSNIYEKFITNKKKINQRSLIKMFSIYKKKKNENIKEILNKWKIKMTKYKFNIYNKFNNRDINNNNNNLINHNNTSLTNFLKDSKSEKNILKPNNIIYRKYLNDTFMNRLSHYSYKSENSKEKIFNSNEEICEISCTFSPNLSLTKSINDNFHKKKISQDFDYPNLKNNKRIYERLYNQYKININNKKILQKKFDSNDGITFAPRINKGKNLKKKIVYK